MWLKQLYANHVLANLAYFLVLILGLLAYQQLPRESAPDDNFKIVQILIALPGASTEDVEHFLLNPVERMLRSKIKNIKHVNSDAQSGLAIINVFFQDMQQALYDRRVLELRRELQNLMQNQLPKEAQAPDIYESNSLSPDSYKILVYGPGEDENFRNQARQVQRDIQQISGVSRADTIGLVDPELHIVFHPERLAGLGISPGALADTVKAYFRDIAAGAVKVNDREWLVRLTGTDNAAENLAALPIISVKGSVKLGELADITRTSKAVKLGAHFRGQPAVVIMPMKQPGANTLVLIDQIKAYIESRNQLSAATGVQLFLLIDTSTPIRQALSVMEQHAWSGMVLVLLVTWLLLGTRLALLSTLAAPFSLAGVFIILQATGHSLNLSVLLGIVIVLGMLVDDAVVVIEAIDQHLRQGFQSLQATVTALKEVWLPVTTSSLTTIAGFLPLMLVTGYLGSVMGVVPQVVCLALLISLIQALWILPAHAVVMVKTENGALWRETMRKVLQRGYAKALIKVLRRPKRSLLVIVVVFALPSSALMLDWLNFSFFPQEPSYGFFVSLEMPSGTPSYRTLATLDEIERRIVPLFKPGELRASMVESGIIGKEGHFLFGHQYGDIWFSLIPGASRDSATLIPLVTPLLAGVSGPVDVWVQGESHNSVGKPINLQITGREGAELDNAIAELRKILSEIAGVNNIRINIIPGLSELKLRMDSEAIQRAGLSPETVTRTVQLLADGESVASYVDQGEPVNVRVRAYQNNDPDITALLRHTVARPDGSAVPLSQLVIAEQRIGPAIIDHIDFQRVLTLQAELDKERMDTLEANRLIKERWEQVRHLYPDIKVNFSGEIEEIQAGLSQLWQKFVLGLGLIFLIVGAQFRSYLLPLVVLLKIPMAFCGVILGLLISHQSVSLYTLYGGVALAGIAVNSAILMFSAAHDRLNSGMSVVHATVSAARRRLLPILITSLTTLVGLLPLALAGDESSTMWRPVATAIVWGVGFSTLLTLFMMPLLYRLAMGWTARTQAL